MTPVPIEPARAVGPMRLVLSAYPSAEAAEVAVRGVLDRRLAACASAIAQRSSFLWRGRRETAEEVLVVFKTVPKSVGRLFRLLAASHPYDVPEIVEVDVGRVADPYLAWLTTTLDPSSWPRTGATAQRPGGPRGRAAPTPARTRGPRRRRSRRTGSR